MLLYSSWGFASFIFICRALEDKMANLLSVKEELERTTKEKDVLQKDLKKQMDENGILLKLREDMTTEICNIQACHCSVV